MTTTADSLHHMVATYRRDSTEVIGAVRRSSVEFLGMEQMPGGKFQVSARTVSGADAFVSPVRTTLADGVASLEAARRSFGGELPGDVHEGAFGDDGFDALTQDWTPEPTPEPEVREPRRPAFAFADIEVPELPTSVF